MRALLSVACAFLVSCGSADTALAVTARFDPSIRLDQLSVSVAGAAGALLGPVNLPEVAQTSGLSSGQTARLLVLDSLAGADAEVRVSGLAGGKAFAFGAARVQPRRGEDVGVTVELSGTAGTDACAAGACRCGEREGCAVGQQCVEGECRCTSTSCAEGCCEHDQCEVKEKSKQCGEQE